MLRKRLEVLIDDIHGQMLQLFIVTFIHIPRLYHHCQALPTFTQRFTMMGCLRNEQLFFYSLCFYVLNFTRKKQKQSKKRKKPD